MYSSLISMLSIIIYFFEHFLYINECRSLFIYKMVYYTYYCSVYSQVCLRLLVYVCVH